MTGPDFSSAPQNPLSPQGAFAAPQGAPAPGPAPSKAPKVLIILGAVIMALSVIGGIVLAVVGIGGAADTSEFEEFPSGAGTVSVEQGDSLQIYVPEGMPVPACEVTGPAVGPGTNQTSTLTSGGVTWVSVDSFSAEEAGEYSIDCGGAMIAVGPPVSVLGILTGIGGILLGLGGGFLGFILLAIGVILLLLRRRKA